MTRSNLQSPTSGLNLHESLLVMERNQTLPARTPSTQIFTKRHLKNSDISFFSSIHSRTQCDKTLFLVKFIAMVSRLPSTPVPSEKRTYTQRRRHLMANGMRP